MKFVLRFLLISILSTTWLHACKFLVVNDSNRKILVVDVQNVQAPFEILPGKEKMAGDPNRHVHYKILERRGGNYIPAYEFEMVSCAKPGVEPRVVMSELAKGSITDLFKLITIKGAQAEQAAGQMPKASHCPKCEQKNQQG